MTRTLSRAWLKTNSAGETIERRFVLKLGEQTFELNKTLVVGSNDRCDVCLSDPHASRMHCEFRPVQGGVAVRDLQSKNGTRVRGVRVEQALIDSDTDIGIGRTLLRIVEEREAVVVDGRTRLGEAIGHSASMQRILGMLHRVADSQVPVLLLGETGTGKSMLAQSIHQESARRDQPFVTLDCAAVSRDLIDSELFGHVKGAYTGARADRAGAFIDASGGTLFLDNLPELPIDLQPRLLRVLEDKTVKRMGEDRQTPVDVRIIAASDRDLEAEVHARRFREDLFFRLSVVVAHLPPLRHRLDDLLPMVQFFAGGDRQIPEPLLRRMAEWSWPGNLRELRNAVERLLLGFAPETPRAAFTSVPAATGLPWQKARDLALEHFTRSYLTDLFAEHGGNLSAIARASGINRNHVRKLAIRVGLMTE